MCGATMSRPILTAALVGSFYLSPIPTISMQAAAGGIQAPEETSPTCRRRRSISLPNPLAGFTVSGRNGPFVVCVDPQTLDNAITKPEALSFANEANNVGDYDGQRLRMPETERALAQMLDQLDNAWPHARHTPFKVHVLANNEYAPAAMPDGSIMVRFGLITRADTDEEVAFLLGHELAHVRLGHFGDDEAIRRKRQLARDVANTYLSGVELSEARFQRKGDGVELALADKAHVQEELTKTAAMRTRVNTLITVMLERPWSRKQEDEADALGMDLALRAGWAGMDAPSSVFQKIQADFELTQATAKALSTTLSEAVASAAQSQNLNAPQGFNPSAFFSIFRNQFVERFKERAEKMAVDYFSQRHRSPEARLSGLQKYSDEAYPDASLVSSRTEWLEGVRSTTEYQEAVTVIASLQDARRLQAEGDISGALAAFAPTQRTRFRNAPVVVNAMADLHGLSGAVNEADRLYKLGHQSPDQSTAAYVSHAWLLVRHRRYTAAEPLIDDGIALAMSRQIVTSDPEAKRREDAQKPFLPALAGLRMQQDKTEEAYANLQKCLDYEDEQLSDLCVRAILGVEMADAARQLTPEQQARVEQMVHTTREKAAVSGSLSLTGVIRGATDIFR